MTRTGLLIERSVVIASRSNGSDGLTRHATTLYRHPDGRWYLSETGGQLMSRHYDPQYCTDRAEAVEWVASNARDPITGYGYTREQAELMVDGVDAGKGYRD